MLEFCLKVNIGDISVFFTWVVLLQVYGIRMSYILYYIMVKKIYINISPYLSVLSIAEGKEMSIFELEQVFLWPLPNVYTPVGLVGSS